MNPNLPETPEPLRTTVPMPRLSADEPLPAEGATALPPALRRSAGGLATRTAMVLAVLVLGGIVVQWAKPVLVPLVLACLLAFLMLPLLRWLIDRRVPAPIAIVVAQLASALPLAGLVLLFAATVGPVSASLPKYQQGIKEQTVASLDKLVDMVGVPEKRRAEIRTQINDRLVPELLDRGVSFVQQSLSAATSAVGYLFLTLLFSVFIQLEGTRIRARFRGAFGEHHPILDALNGIGEDVRAYVVAKSVVGAVTAVAVFLFLELMGVDFSVFWALLAFPLNFIPTVGAIAASLPPILVAWVDPEMSSLSTLLVTVGLLGINAIIGSVIDPRYVGHAVKLSPLVVFVSMLVWGLLWGPVGMILAVPLMVSVKLVFQRIPALEPVAMLMRG